MEEREPDALGRIATSRGEAFVGGGNRPVSLSDPETVWYVVKGAVDVFIARNTGAEEVSDFKQLLRAGAGRLVFGIGGGGTTPRRRTSPRASPTPNSAASPGRRSPDPRPPNRWPGRSIPGSPTSPPRSPAR